MECSINLELAQKLVMTPQLRQAIAILQLPSVELAAVAEKALLENPVLELEDHDNSSNNELDKNSESDKTDEPINSLDEFWEWADYVNDAPDINFGYVQPEVKATFESYVTTATTLQDHLEFQLHLALFDETARRIGEHLIGSIDDNGYLRATVTELAKQLAVPEQAVAEILALIQTFDPAGVGARDLQECLQIQLGQRNGVEPLVFAIVAEHLNDVAAGRFKQIADKLNRTPHDVQRAVDFIRTLDPRPGRAFDGHDSSHYIIPDVTVKKVNGDYTVIVNDTTVPRLTINPYYRRVAGEGDSNVRKYVEGRINAAVWLIKGIEQRRLTLYRVMEAIVDIQRQFFDYGPKFVRPLTMKTVADKLSIHESTVSRAIANKYAATSHGLVSLRSFFTAGITRVNGPELSATVVKQEIKSMIAREDSSHPVSDQALTDMLAARGISLSSRTVAKYREELGIPSSSKRKRY
jgi:RNA polymerase sigma-54 factor